jgi:type II secretory pathway pseudopilin PulG
MVELLTVVAISAVLLAGVMIFVGNYITWAKNTADKQTYTVLNDALNRYKGEGGSVNALTVGAPIADVLAAMKTPCTLAGNMSHQFLDSAWTYPARSIQAMGNGEQYQFYQVNTYAASTPPLGTPTSSGAYGDLIINGTGLDGNNTNFSHFTYDSSDTYNASGSFLSSANNAQYTSDTMIPVDPNGSYTLSCWGKCGDVGGGNFVAANSQYFGLAPYDADGNSIKPHHYTHYVGSADTTLASTLNTGDTTMTLSSTSGWYGGGGSYPYDAQISWWPYTNNEGYSWPNYTYTRNGSYNYSPYNSGNTAMWNAGGISGNVITLASPWPGPTLPAGTPIRNASDGGTYQYVAAGNEAIPNTWTHYSGTISGINTAGTPGDQYQFPYATTQVKVLFLINNGMSGATNDVRWSDLILHKN